MGQGRGTWVDVPISTRRSTSCENISEFPKQLLMQEVLENTLDAKIIGPTDVFGVDYLPAK